MGAGAGQVHVDFSAEELAALLPRIDVDRLPGVVLPDSSAEVLAAATRGLVARGVLTGEGAEAEVLEAVRELLLLAGRPTVLASATSASGPVVWAGDDEIVVRVAERVPGVWRATPLAVGDLAGEVIGLLPAEGEAGSGPAFEVAVLAHDRALGVAATDPAAAILELRAAGVEEAAASAYVAAAAGGVVGGLAVVRRSKGQVTGDSFGWLDAGPHGVWGGPAPLDLPDILEQVDAEDSEDWLGDHRGTVRVAIAPVSAAALRGAVATAVAEVTGGTSS